MQPTSSSTLTDAWLAHLERAWKSPHARDSHNGPTRELLGAVFRIESPRARLIISRERRWSLPYAIGEFLWHARGSQATADIEYYAPRWREIVGGEDAVRGSCYGARLFGAVNVARATESAWSRAKRALSHDRASRRAWLPIFDVSDLVEATDTPDSPCTCGLQFIVSDDRLHCITTMRSNDLMLGFGYDVFFFTMLQEWMAVELGLALGWYQHQVGSLHLYERDVEKAERILREQPKSPPPMPVMPSPPPRKLRDYEAALRTSEKLAPKPRLDAYWSVFADVLAYYAIGRQRAATQTQSRGMEDRLRHSYAAGILRLPRRRATLRSGARRSASVKTA